MVDILTERLCAEVEQDIVVPANQLEATYVNMPRIGLGQAGMLHPAKGNRATATKRLGRRPPTPPAAPPG